MKYILIVALSISPLSHCIEQQNTHEPREWDATEYAEGNARQETMALHYMESSSINVDDKEIVDIGCGTGNITAIIAKKAKNVLGIDASKNMIEYAQKEYNSISNLSFEKCFAEDFTSTQLYDYAFSFHCLHWIKDKKQVFQNIHKSLKPDGEFLGTIITKSNTRPLGLIVGLELFSQLKNTNSYFANLEQENDIGALHITDEEMKNILQETGFEIISYKEEQFFFTFKNRAELEKMYRSIVMGRPFMKSLSNEEKESYFKLYIDLFLTKLHLNDNNEYTTSAPIFISTIIHAKKKS